MSIRSPRPRDARASSASCRLDSTALLSNPLAIKKNRRAWIAPLLRRVLPLGVYPAEDERQIVGNEKAVVEAFERGAGETAEVLVAIVVAIDDLRFRPGDVRADETGARIGEADLRIAKVPAGVGRQRNGDLRQVNAGDVDAVAVDLRYQRRVDAVDARRFGGDAAAPLGAEFGAVDLVVEA